MSDAVPNPPQVPAGTRVYAIGDIHGCAAQLRALHKLIEQDAATAPPRRVAVYVGDYIDRGPDICETVDLLIREPIAGFESIHLIGNHEAFLLQFLEDEGVALPWLMNGGDATCRSYGVDPHARPDFAGRFAWLQKELAGLHGESRRISAVGRTVLDDGLLTIEAVAVAKFSDFGIRPYSALLGAVKNLDEFHLFLSLRAHAQG